MGDRVESANDDAVRIIFSVRFPESGYIGRIFPIPISSFLLPSRILQYTHRIQDTSLREWLKYGIAIHTAGLCFSLLPNSSQIAPQDRNLVETLFENGLIQVVCTTSTLALGVNLPVYLVIIKGTVQWKGGGRGYEEIDNAMLQQMVVKSMEQIKDRLGEQEGRSSTRRAWL